MRQRISCLSFFLIVGLEIQKPNTKTRGERRRVREQNSRFNPHSGLSCTQKITRLDTDLPARSSILTIPKKGTSFSFPCLKIIKVSGSAAHLNSLCHD